MSLSNTNPTQAIFERVVVRAVTSPDLQQGRLIHVLWVAPNQGDRLVQLYCNGQLVSVSASTGEREAWLLLDPSTHHEVELLAVDPSDAAVDGSHLLSGNEASTRTAAELALLRDYDLPIDSVLTVESASAGVIDPTPLFSRDKPRGGFGAVFGQGGFGYDASTGPGLGIGELGFGPLGVDGIALRWRNDALPTGDYSIDLSLDSDAGQAFGDSISRAITRLPDPPGNVSLSSDLKLTWT